MHQMILKLSNEHFLYKFDDSLMWLFDTKTGKQKKLNESSHFVLSLFDGKRTVYEIRQLYIEKYYESIESKEVLLKDFNSLLDILINAQVLTLKK